MSCYGVKLVRAPSGAKAGPANYPPTSQETVFAKPHIKYEQMINMAHKLTSLQAYNFLQVDNKDRSFRTALCLVQNCDAFAFVVCFWFFPPLLVYCM